MSTNANGAQEVGVEQPHTHAILRGAIEAVVRYGVVACGVAEREWKSPSHLEQRTEEKIARIRASMCVRNQSTQMVKSLG
jgi:hypothetical protein